MNQLKIIKDKVFSCIVLFASLNVAGQTPSKNEKFTLSGKIIGQLNGCVFLKYVNKEGKKITDSSEIKKGNFYFKGYITEPTLAIFSKFKKPLPDNDPNVTDFYLEARNMTATAKKNHLKEIKITGSKTQKEKKIFERRVAAITNESDSVNEKISEISYQFIFFHPDSYYSALLLALYKSRWPIDSVSQLYNQLSPLIQKSFYGKDVAEAINKIDDNSKGKMAKLFTAIDINEESISLSNFKSRYVLLDFWASWCVPCRQGNSHLIALFKKYHDKGLDIIGVSDDEDIEAWKTAVKKDKIGIWYNILGLKKDKDEKIDDSNRIGQMYGVQTLPTKILIDKSGMIIGRYGGTGGEDEKALDAKLNEIFE